MFRSILTDVNMMRFNRSEKLTNKPELHGLHYRTIRCSFAMYGLLANKQKMEMHIMMNVKKINNDTIGVFDVVVNHQEQYSILSNDKVLPNGWTYVGIRDSRENCLSYISKHWNDLTPKIVKKYLSK